MIFALVVFQSVRAQITITSADMPVAGDTLRYSIMSPVGAAISPGDSGASMIWNYALTSMSQGVDTYQTALSVNLLYGLIGLTAYGYKVADSFPIAIPLLPAIRNIYTFFEEKSGPSRYETKAFAASIAGVPTPINYTTPDVWYFFPLNYGNDDSASYKLNITLPSFGGIKEIGYRKTRVDGWGTIATPYYTTPANCIRVRSEIHEVDSVQFGMLPAIGFPRNSVEYKWLVNGEHYPALWVTSNLLPGGTETISSIRYRDNPGTPPVDTNSKVATITNTITVIKAWPVPAENGMVTLDIPAGWQTFDIVVFDMASKEVASFKDQKEINISALAKGRYLGLIASGASSGLVELVR